MPAGVELTAPDSAIYQINLSCRYSSLDICFVEFRLVDQDDLALIQFQGLVTDTATVFEQQTSFRWVATGHHKPWLIQLAECALEEEPRPPVIPSIRLEWRAPVGDTAVLDEAVMVVLKAG